MKPFAVARVLRHSIAPSLAAVLAIAAGCATNDVALGGPATVVRVDPEPPGQRCLEGGVAIHTGLDDDDDLYLDDDEIASTQYTCNGSTLVQCSGGIVKTGPIAIHAAADWAAIAATHCVDGDLLVTDVAGAMPDLPDLSTVTGDVVIVGNPGITSLAGLSHLRQVGGRLLVQGNHALTTLAGLDAVERAESIAITGNDQLVDVRGLGRLINFGGGIYIAYNDALTSLAGLEKLRDVRTLSITSNARLASIEALSSLDAVGILELTGQPALTSASLPSLERVSQRLIVNDNAKLTTLGLPALLTTGELFMVQGNPVLRGVAAPALVTAGSVRLGGNNQVAIVDLPRLVYLTGLLELSGLPLLNDLRMNAVRSIGVDVVVTYMARLSSFGGLSSLESIGGAFVVRQNGALTDFTGLGKLGLVAGDLTVMSNATMTSFAGLEKLTKVGGTLTVSDNPRVPAAVTKAFVERMAGPR